MVKGESAQFMKMAKTKTEINGHTDWVVLKVLIYRVDVLQVGFRGRLSSRFDRKPY